MMIATHATSVSRLARISGTWWLTRNCSCAVRGSTAAAALILFGVLLTLANNMLSYSFHTYQAELFPTRIRASAVGFVYSFSRLSVVFSSFVIGFVLNRAGVPGVFALIAGSMVVVMLAIGVLGPRTNRLALETISQ